MRCGDLGLFVEAVGEGESGEGFVADEGFAGLGHAAGGEVGALGEDQFGGEEFDVGVAEEFEAFVVHGLVVDAGVGEGGLGEGGIGNWG